MQTIKIDKNNMPKRFILGISGASGIKLARGFLAHIVQDFEVHIIISKGALECAQYELKCNEKELKNYLLESCKPNSSNIDSNKTQTICIYDDSEIGAPVASGSFGTQAMAIIPTSMDCLAKISCGISDTLLTRAASAMIKERKMLLLAPREMPLNAIVCEQMRNLASLGVIIAPPIIAYYSYPNNLEEMENFIYGKWLDILGIKNSLFARWGDTKA